MSARFNDYQSIRKIQAPVLGLERAIHDGPIETNLLHLIKLRASQINGCAYCLAMHSRDLRLAGEREDRLHVLPAWRETSWFSPREQAALAFTEAVTTLEGQHVPDEVFAQAREQFSEEELALLTLAVATINVWNRICITWGIPPESFIVPAEEPVPVGASSR